MKMKTTEETAACTTVESAEGFSLSSGRGRRGLGRGGSFFVRPTCASAVGCPSPQPSPRSFLTGRGGWRCRLFCGLLSKHFLFAMIGCAALAQNTSFAAPSGLASDGKSASEKAGNLHRSKSGAAAKEKSVENERTKKRALAIRPQSVVPPAQRSLKNARDRGSGPAIIGGPADSKKNASALIGGPANATRKTAVIDGTALRNR